MSTPKKIESKFKNLKVKPNTTQKPNSEFPNLKHKPKMSSLIFVNVFCLEEVGQHGKGVTLTRKVR